MPYLANVFVHYFMQTSTLTKSERLCVTISAHWQNHKKAFCWIFTQLFSNVLQKSCALNHTHLVKMCVLSIEGVGS